MPYLLEVFQGGITATDTDVIVNAANNHFWMGSGVAGAIKAAGGESIEEEAKAKGPVFPGDAIYTGAGKLRCKYIIHAAVMGQDLKTNDKLIRIATMASLNLAEKLRVTSIAFPAFGTGVGGFPMKACAYQMVMVVRGFQTKAKSLTRVQFCVLDELGYACFSQEIAKQR